jgi:hypothetical protein
MPGRSVARWVAPALIGIGLAACSTTAPSPASGFAPVAVVPAGAPPPPSAPPAVTPPPPVDPWPRDLTLSNADALIYQPQIDSWTGNRLAWRVAVALRPSGSKTETFGVLWGTARTEVDRTTRSVNLEEVAITKSNFPTLPQNGAAYLPDNAQTGQRTYDSSASATGAGGSTVDRNAQSSWGPQGDSRSASTTTYNAQTGQTKTWNNGVPSNTHYAGSDGNVYRSDGSGGWQRPSSSGSWQSAPGSNDWANQEQQARSDAESRTSNYGSGGWDRSGHGSGSWASRYGGDGASSWADRFGGEADRWGGGGGWGNRFGGGGFGDRFGGFRR